MREIKVQLLPLMLVWTAVIDGETITARLTDTSPALTGTIQPADVDRLLAGEVIELTWHQDGRDPFTGWLITDKQAEKNWQEYQAGRHG